MNWEDSFWGVFASLAFVGSMVYLFFSRRQDKKDDSVWLAQQKEVRSEFRHLIDITGSNSWSSDDTFLRLHQLNRFQNTKLTWLEGKEREKLEDTILILERVAARKHGDDAPPETIIGYGRE